MQQFKHYIFDLDGTLTNPSEGIFRSILYAFKRLGVNPPERAEVDRQIGPPLSEMLGKLIPGANQNLIECGMRLFRERYSEVGLFENIIYDGIEDALKFLSARSVLSVATSKPELFAERILERLKLRQYFRNVFGVTITSRQSEKNELIRKAILAAKFEPAESVMVGDRESDIFGAKMNRIGAVGVLWGFGSVQELEIAGADVVIAKAGELLK